MLKIDYINLAKQKIWDGIVAAIHHSDALTTAHVYIDAGIVLPPHSHHNEQWSHVIEGEFQFLINDEIINLGPGQSCYIPPHQSHGGRAITACKIIDCFHPPREDWKDLPFV